MCCSRRFSLSGYDEPTLRNIPYETFLRTAKTGDELLYEGKGWTSSIIKGVSQAKYSHSGSIVRMKDGSMYVWESTKPDGTFDFLTLTDKDGPRLINVHEQLYMYGSQNYSVTYRPLKIYDASIKRYLASAEAQESMWTVFREMSKVPYEKNLLEMANAHKHWKVGGLGIRGYDSRKSIYCSELNIITLHEGMHVPLTDPVTGLEFTATDFTPEDLAWETEGLPFTTPYPMRTITSGKGKGSAATTTISGVPEGYTVTALFGIPRVVASRSHIDPLLRDRYTRFSSILELYKVALYGKLPIDTPAEQKRVYGRMLSDDEMHGVKGLTQRIHDLRRMYLNVGFGGGGGEGGMTMMTERHPSVVIDFGSNAKNG